MSRWSVLEVRIRPEGFEGRCPDCREWWALDLEFWNKPQGLARCRACNKDRHAKWQNNRYHTDPEVRAKKIAAAALSARIERRTNPLGMSDKKRAYYERHRERILANEKARYWARKAA